MIKIQVMIWVVTLCSDVVGCQCFGGHCCLHLQSEVIGSSTGTGVVAMQSTLLAYPCGHGVKLCVGSCPNTTCNGETFTDYLYCYLFPNQKRDKTNSGVLIMLHVQ